MAEQVVNVEEQENRKRKAPTTDAPSDANSRRHQSSSPIVPIDDNPLNDQENRPSNDSDIWEVWRQFLSNTDNTKHLMELR